MGLLESFARVVESERGLAGSPEPFVRMAMETTGEMVSLCVRLGGEDVAAMYAAQGLRAARLLGLYSSEG